MVLMTDAKRKQMRMTFMALEANLRNMENTILELMRHPEARANQIMECHESYTKIHASVQRVRSVLESKGVLSWR